MECTLVLTCLNPLSTENYWELTETQFRLGFTLKKPTTRNLLGTLVVRVLTRQPYPVLLNSGGDPTSQWLSLTTANIAILFQPPVSWATQW